MGQGFVDSVERSGIWLGLRSKLGLRQVTERGGLTALGRYSKALRVGGASVP